MDLPPSGWYPDPHGTPSLLRWWDGSAWTQHTHPDVSTGGSGGDLTATAAQPAVQPAAGQATGLQATTVQPAAGQAGTGQAGTGLTAGVQATTVQPSVGQPSAEWLSKTKPPKGRPTAPQPALPAFPGAPTGPAPTAYQAPVTAVQPDGMQATVIQPGYPQPASLPPRAVHAGGAGQPGGAWQPSGEGTQAMFLGNAWQTPGGAPPGNPYGYREAQRRRRRVIVGITAGTAVAIAAIAIIATTLGNSPATPVADQGPAATPTSAATTASPTPTSSGSPTASPTPTATAAGSLLTDGQAGLSYTQLSAPWQGASCPSTLNNGAFPWTAGEYAAAGQVNGGSTTWYGEACSGLLPSQYGYTGAADLQNTTENLAQTFGNAYYNSLDHSVNPGQDQPVQVSGHAGWEVTYDVTYTNAAAQGVTWPDEQAAVVVVDTGTSQPAVFFTSIPQNLNESEVTALVSSLQLTSASTGSGQAATATAAATQNNGNGNP